MRYVLLLALVITGFWAPRTTATVWGWSLEPSPSGAILRLRGGWSDACAPTDEFVTRTGSTLSLHVRIPTAACDSAALREKVFPVLGSITGAKELLISYDYLPPGIGSGIWHYTSVEGLALPTAWTCEFTSSWAEGPVSQPGILGVSGFANATIHTRLNDYWNFVRGLSIRREGDALRFYFEVGYAGLPHSFPAPICSYKIALSPGRYQLELYPYPAASSFARRIAASQFEIQGNESVPIPISQAGLYAFLALLVAARARLRMQS
jgi:hypothetical protein